jgi:tetratricopeptide (TPR) repeat protein
MAGKKVKRARVLRTGIENVQSEKDIEAPIFEVEIEEEILAEDIESVQGPAVSMRVRMWERIGRFCLMAAVFLVPLFFLPVTQNPLDTNKIIMVGFLMLVAFVSFLTCVIEKRKFEYPKALLTLAVLTFVAATGASAYFSIARAQSLYGYLRQPDSFMIIVICALAFFLSFYFLRKDDIKKLGKLIIASFIVATFLGLLQIFSIFIFPWDFAKTAAFNVVGSLSAWGICMAVIVASLATVDLGAVSARARQLLIAVIILMSLGLVALNYQFLWISLAVIAGIMASVRFVSREHFRLPLAIGIVALIFTLVGSHIPNFIKVPAEVRPDAASTLTLGASTLKGFRILTGTGPATFNLDFARYRPITLNQTNFWNMPFFQGYSYVFTLLATGGLLGILAFLFIFLAAARYLMVTHEHQYAAMLLTGILFFFVSLFFYPAFFAELFLIFMGLGAIVPDNARREVPLEGGSRWKAFIVFIIVLACIALSLAAGYHVGQKYIAAIEYKRAGELFSTGRNDPGFGALSSALVLDTQSDEYLRGASQVLIAEASQAMQAGGPNAGALVQKDVSSAIQAAQSAVAINPNDVNNILSIAGVYESIIPIASGADQMAEDWYRKALLLDPFDPQIPVLMARAQIAAGDQLAKDPTRDALRNQNYADAESMLKKSIDLKSDYAAARFLLAQLYIRQGNVTQAIQRVEEIKAANPFDAGVAFQLGLLYYQSNQADEAQVEFERAVSMDQNYSNARYFLGLIYDKKGMHAEAMDQFQKILTLNPDNTDVKTIIANLQAGKSPLQSVTSSSTPPENRSDVPVPDKPKQ